MTREYRARLGSLDTREAAKLFGLDRHLLPEANLVRSATKEADTVGVEGFVNGRGARLCACDGDTSSGLLGLELDSPEMAVTEVLDDRGLHGELDQIHGYEPNDVL